MPDTDIEELVKKPSIKQLIGVFVHNVRSVISTHMDPPDRQLFRPARSKERRLHGYGFLNHLPCISAQMCINDEAAKGLHEMLASLNIKLPTKRRELLHDGRLVLKCKPLAKKLPTPWEVNLPSRASQLSGLWEATKRRANEQPVKEPSSFEGNACLDLFCHVCELKKSHMHTVFLKGVFWKPLRCRNCSLSRKASKWLCSCGTPWHACTTHRKVGLAVQKQGHQKATVQKQAKEEAQASSAKKHKPASELGQAKHAAPAAEPWKAKQPCTSTVQLVSSRGTKRIAEAQGGRGRVSKEHTNPLKSSFKQPHSNARTKGSKEKVSEEHTYSVLPSVRMQAYHKRGLISEEQLSQERKVRRMEPVSCPKPNARLFSPGEILQCSSLKKAKTHKYTVEGSSAGACSSGVLSSSVNDASG